MYYRLNKDVFFRDFGEIGYITSTGLYEDRVVDAFGSIFLKALTREPEHIDTIASRIASCFADTESSTVKQDAIDFYKQFIDDGFLVCGMTQQEANNNITGFTYNAVNPRTIKRDFTPVNKRANENSQSALNDFFLTNPTLIKFQIELTSKCNERCLHCYIPHEFKNECIDPTLYNETLDQLDEMGAWHITLSGGEPMLHPHFKEFLRAAKNHGFYTTVLSNLTLLDDEIITIMREGNVSSVQVSLYSVNPEHHDQITQLPGSFEKTKSAIEKLIENDIPVQISCPTMKENKNDFGNVLRWAHEHKIRAITDYSIMAEYNNDTSNLSHRLNPDECGEVIKDIIEWDVDYQNEILSPEFEKHANVYLRDLDAPLCGVGITTCSIASNGNIYPCPGWQSYVCGNLNQETLKDIWENSEKMNKLRFLRRRDFKPCTDCNKQYFCSPCLVRNANESKTGNPLDVNPYFCEVAKINKELVMEWRENQMKGSCLC